MAVDFSHVSPKSYHMGEYNNGENKLRLHELEPEKKKKKPQPFMDSFKEYMSSTTLHGFRYIADGDISWMERLWWLIMVSCSIGVCSVLILQLWNKWEESPVIVSFADTSNSVWHIPFPAVTICIETKPKKRVFNFTKVYHDLHSNPPVPVSPEDRQTYRDMLLICNYASDPDGGPQFADKSAVETIYRLAPKRDEVFLECLWDNLNCEQMFHHTLTKDGVCFTFNMLSAPEMFRMENLHTDYIHVSGHNKSAWTLGKGYPPGETIKTYPRRGPSYGGVEFEAIMKTDIRDQDLECRGPVQGFKVWLHNPAELPNMGQNFFRLPIMYQSAAAVTPRVTDTSEGLLHYPPHKRNCFFPEERYLRFFRIYTQRNCELECASNHTAFRCDCVPLYMPHGPETKICGYGSRSCVSDAIEELSLAKSSLDPNAERQTTKCNCLQACTELKYDAEVSQALYDLNGYYHRHPDPDVRNENRLPSGLVVYFAEELFTSLRRSEWTGGLDFISSCGGTMGLFLGFSFLSVVEFIYYFTFRLWCKFRRSSRVVAE